MDSDESALANNPYISHCKCCGEYVFITIGPLLKFLKRRTDSAHILTTKTILKKKLLTLDKPVIIKRVDSKGVVCYEKRILELCQKCKIPIAYSCVPTKESADDSTNGACKKDNNSVICILDNSVYNRSATDLKSIDLEG